ncbi:MAG: (d)CMP kinase [Bdellovibrionaceae bacterium]|nr:(d)CMP kinase [Pseudobdellovibrionaceae bacterium]MDW8190092.1 (d)CMP kinase [Pseudobdellovibrionaceae bacterium]
MSMHPSASSKSTTHEKLITIDGPSASGKSTLSRHLSRKLGWEWVSTGAFYRGLAFVALEENISLEEGTSLAKLAQDQGLWQVVLAEEATRVFYRNQDVTQLIRHEDIGLMASRISKIPVVRQALLQAQRDCYHPTKGLIAEGRDCGTVVFPQAPLKIFLTADLESRSQRRSLQELGTNQSESLKQKQLERDTQDAQRSVAPTAKALDALEIDTTHIDPEQLLEMILSIIKTKYAEWLKP